MAFSRDYRDNYGCEPGPDADHWTISVPAKSGFHPVETKADLAAICNGFPASLLLGVFDWSNFSQQVYWDMFANQSWFSNLSIGMGIVSLNSPRQIETISVDFHAHLMSATTEPILAFSRGHVLSGAITGPHQIDEIKRWVQQLLESR